MTTEKILKNHLLRSHKGNEAETAEMFVTLASIKIMFFIAVARAFVAMTVSIDLYWEKWK